MAARYLIIGASGFVGRRLFSVLGPANAVATYHNRTVEGGIAFDAAGMRLADTVLKQHRNLTHAFILLGVTNIDACARDPRGTAGVNVAGTQRVIDDLVAAGVVPVFASSDAVFDGSRGMWAEDDMPNPILTYGRQKLEVERYLCRATPSGLVLRLAKVIGSAPGGNELLGGWVSKLESGARIRCAHDQVFSPLTVDDAVAACVKLAEAGHTGTFHVCGPRPVTRIGLLRMLVEELGRYRELAPQIEECSLRDFPFVEPRPLDTSMSPRKLYAALGRGFEDLRETCRSFAAARHAESSALKSTGRASPH